MPKITQKGFTLVELLIAISILSLLLFTGSYAYSLMSQRWNKELGQFAHTASLAKSNILLEKLLEGVFPFVVTNKDNTPSFFFIGSENSLLSVSHSGLVENTYPVVFRLSAIKNKNGTFDLIYQSVSTKNFLLLKTEQEFDFERKITLFKQLDNIQFNYFGWNNITEKSNASEFNTVATWKIRYSGIDTQLTPEKLSVILTKQGKPFTIVISLDSNPERLLSPYFNDAD